MLFSGLKNAEISFHSPSFFSSSLFSPSEARVYLDINAPTFVQIPIVLAKWKSVDKTPPALSEKVYEILANDLTLSGFFRVIDVHHFPIPLKKEKESQIVLPAGMDTCRRRNPFSRRSPLESDGLNLKLKFHLFDLVEQKHLVGKQYEGPSQTLRSGPPDGG